MARAFASASSQHFTRTGAVLTANPMTMACWFNPTALTTHYCLICLGNNGAQGLFRLSFDGASANDPVKANAQTDAGVGGTATVNTSISAGTWHHAAAVFASTTSRTAYIDGAAGTADTTSVTAATADFTTIGAQRINATSLYMNGSLAEVAIWNIALSANDIAMLAAGYSPLCVRPEALAGGDYWPFFARATDEEGWCGGNVMTNTNSATAADHPRILYRRNRQIILPEVVAAATIYQRRTLGQRVGSRAQ